MSYEQNLTPEQREFPNRIHRLAYSRIPMTCESVWAILLEAQHRLMDELKIDPAEVATVDAVMSQAFRRIRDEVTQPFRTEQMKLLANQKSTSPKTAPRPSAKVET